MFIESVMLSNHLILCHPFLLPLVFPNIRVFSSKSALHIRWAKYWNFSFSISPSNEYSGLISFWIDWSPYCPRDSQEFYSTTVQKHQFFATQSSSWSKSHICPWLLEKPSQPIFREENGPQEGTEWPKAPWQGWESRNRPTPPPQANWSSPTPGPGSQAPRRPHLPGLLPSKGVLCA